jgi:hypothetical protein
MYIIVDMAKKKFFKQGLSFGNMVKDGGSGISIGKFVGIHRSGANGLTPINIKLAKKPDVKEEDPNGDKEDIEKGLNNDFMANRYPAGFTPDVAYGRDWAGNLIDAHILSENNNINRIDTKDRVDIGLDDRTISTRNDVPLSRRDHMIRFNSLSTDYFVNYLQIMGGDGSSSYENQDPILFSFDVIIDAISSPLLNGSIDDFLDGFQAVSELQSRRIVYHDFKNQFEKIFKTKGSISYKRGYSPGGTLMSSNGVGDPLNAYANSERSRFHMPGKKAYLSHYLKKISGLSKLVEANSGDTNKYFSDYGRDFITLSFNEDVSMTMGTLAHLYKLLYWSKPNGKNLVPENLLRFNCEIVVTEIRDFKRVRKMIQDGEVYYDEIKDNLSRYIYSLRECQFFFDKMPHEDIIDLSAEPKVYDSYEVNFTYKYSALKMEKWVPSSGSDHGKYVGYNSGSIWKIGNIDRTTRETSGGNTGDIIDKSVPAFYTEGTNTLNEPGVATAIRLSSTKSLPVERTEDDERKPIADVDGQVVEDAPTKPKTEEAKKEKSGIEKFKDKSKQVAKKMIKKAANFAVDEINNQITIRAKILNATIQNIMTATGNSGIQTEPKRVYPIPYGPNSYGIFFDVRNELMNFMGENISTAIGGFGNVLNPTSNPMNPSANPLSSIVQKYSTIPTVIKNNGSMVEKTLDAIVSKYSKKK